MDFAAALKALKRGDKIMRKAWKNGPPYRKWIPKTREPVVRDGIVYLKLSKGKVAVLDVCDIHRVRGKTWWFCTVT